MGSSNNINKKRSYEMGYTLAEFDKTLQGQFITEQSTYACVEISATQWEIIIDSSPQKILIHIAESAPRIIAMLSLPVLKVDFVFIDMDEDKQKKFLSRFFKYFHKGGG